MQVARASGGVSADEGVAGGQRESGRGEAERAEHAMFGDQQVAQLGRGVEDGAAGMLAGEDWRRRTSCYARSWRCSETAARTSIRASTTTNCWWTANPARWLRKLNEHGGLQSIRAGAEPAAT